MKTRRNSQSLVNPSSSAVTTTSTNTCTIEEECNGNMEKPKLKGSESVESTEMVAVLASENDKENSENMDSSTSIPLLLEDAKTGDTEEHHKDEEEDSSWNTGDENGAQYDIQDAMMSTETPEKEFELPRVSFFQSSYSMHATNATPKASIAHQYSPEDDSQTLSPSSPHGWHWQSIRVAASKRQAEPLPFRRNRKVHRLNSDVRSLETSWTLMENKIKSITQAALELNAETNRAEAETTAKQRQLSECQAMMQEDHNVQLNRVQFLYDQCSTLYNQIQSQEYERKVTANENEQLKRSLYTLKDERHFDQQNINKLERKLAHKDELVSIETKRCEQLLASLSAESRERKRDKMKMESLEEEQAKSQVTLKNLRERLKIMQAPIKHCNTEIDSMKEQLQSIRVSFQNDIHHNIEENERVAGLCITLSQFLKKNVQELESTKEQQRQFQSQLASAQMALDKKEKEVVRLQECIQRQARRIESISASEASKDGRIRQLKEERDLLLDETKQLRERLLSFSTARPQTPSRQELLENCQLSTEPKSRKASSLTHSDNTLALVHLVTGQKIYLGPEQTVYLGRVLLATHDIFIKNAHISRHHVSATVQADGNPSIIISHCARNCSYIIRESLVTELKLVDGSALRDQTSDASEVFSGIFDDATTWSEHGGKIEVLRDRGTQSRVADGDIVLLQPCNDAAFLVIRTTTRNP
eukprot:gb/GECG01000228.1/.p1 GENE.gb/GECG01000228.1/~~gb/GECG01000228.1/.p1  ORF type:complete len:704 (+),score=110.37 gb/GECG01000228.1/:1-2112(+)